MPHKFNAERRHHIPKMQFKMRNWAEYEAGLRRRSSLTLWVTESAIEVWLAPPRSTRGGPAIYSESAIQTCLMLRSAFKLALRQAEGLMNSVFELLGCELAVPDHTTVSRAIKLPSIARATLPGGSVHVLIDSTGLKIYGVGEWLADKHGRRAPRQYRKLHLAVDAHSGQIVGVTLTGQDVDDSSQVAPLLEQTPTRSSKSRATEPMTVSRRTRPSQRAVWTSRWRFHRGRVRCSQPIWDWTPRAATFRCTRWRRWAGSAGSR